MKRLLLATALFIGTVHAAMAIDFTQELTTFDGKSFTDEHGLPNPQVLGTVAENSLLQTVQGEPVDEKNRRFWLALKIHDHPKDAQLTADELVMIKKAIGTYQSVAIMGQAYRLLDPSFKPNN